MATFYRFLTVYGGTKIKFHKSVGRSPRVMAGHDVPPQEFEWCFDELDSDLSNYNVKVYRAPCVDEKWASIDTMISLKKGVDLPDVRTSGSFVAVSSKVKKIILELDSFEHQFVESDFTDKKGAVLNEQQYFRLNVRKFLSFDHYDENFFAPRKSYDVSPKERKMLSAIQNNDFLKNELAKIPLWRIWGQRNIVYFNEELLSLLRSENVSGIQTYSEVARKPGQGVISCG